MGLAGAKTKRKWSKDPNNTKWSRNADGFGQKMLRSQGWEPGQYLGAENAVHSKYYGDASASHIRAVLKDDNLGLGAKRNQGDECTGLDAFQDLLSRLNGKSDESIQVEQKFRSDVKINHYLQRRVGTMRFVSGGFLVGDQVQELLDVTKKDYDENADASETSDASTDVPKDKKKSKKRKADNDTAAGKLKREKKYKKQKIGEDGEETTKAQRKEARRIRREAKEARRKDKASASASESKSDEEDETEATDRKKVILEKKEKKEKRRKVLEGGEDGDSVDASDSKKKKKRKDKSSKDKEAASSALPTPSLTPTSSGTSTPTVIVPGRHLSRQRFIAQKRLAYMDPVALNQIFMIKS